MTRKRTPEPVSDPIEDATDKIVALTEEFIAQKNTIKGLREQLYGDDGEDVGVINLISTLSERVTELGDELANAKAELSRANHTRTTLQEALKGATEKSHILRSELKVLISKHWNLPS